MQHLQFDQTFFTDPKTMDYNKLMSFSMFGDALLYCLYTDDHKYAELMDLNILGVGK